MLNAPEIPQQPNQQPADVMERLIRHIDERFTEVREALERIKECIPTVTVAQLEARLDHLEHEQQRLESKLDELWREHTRLANRSE